MVHFKVSDQFVSYEQFTEALKQYSNLNYVHFYKREARTITAARRKTERVLNPKLKYYQLKYACIKGGKQFQSKGKGKQMSSTYKDGCSAHITLRVSKCGQYLEIVGLSENHNHDINKELYAHLPQQRRLPEDLKAEITQLAKSRANKKLLKSQIEDDKYGKKILLKDLHNKSDLLEDSDATKNILEQSVSTLKDQNGADCHVLYDNANNFKGLFFQTSHMRQRMLNYPEFICIDSTYKLLDIKLPVLMIINEDSNGITHIVAVAILTEENSDTMQYFFAKFKECNRNWMAIKSIIADKDLNKLLLNLNFPNANVFMCAFQAMRTFKKEIYTTKLDITVAQRQIALDIVEKMVYCKNSSEYNAFYNELLQSCCNTVIQYFNKNWHSNKDEWVLGSKFRHYNFLDAINNCLEWLNSKMKSIIEKYTCLTNFINDFFQLITVMNDENEKRAALLMYKRPVSTYEKESVLETYFNYLTAYAFKFVKKQIETKNINEKTNFETTPVTCNCDSFSAILLPCRHIFKERENKGLNLFDENLCHVRWTRNYYFQNHRLIKNENDDNSGNTTPILNQTETKLVSLNQQQKFNKAWLLLKSLARSISEEEDLHYHSKLRQLMQLKSAWEQGHTVKLAINEENHSSQQEHFVERSNEFLYTTNDISFKMEENDVFMDSLDDTDIKAVKSENSEIDFGMPSDINFVNIKIENSDTTAGLYNPNDLFVPVITRKTDRRPKGNT